MLAGSATSSESGSAVTDPAAAPFASASAAARAAPASRLVTMTCEALAGELARGLQAEAPVGARDERGTGGFGHARKHSHAAAPGRPARRP